MRVVFGSDHAGFRLKQMLIGRLGALPDVQVADVGTYAAEPPVDYPDFARAVSEEVARGRADRGVVVCGSGAGACIAADKVPGARAFFAGDSYTAHQAVEHDDGTVLCLGERITGPELAWEIVLAFLGARFSNEERHVRRVEKIVALDNANHFPMEALRREGQSIWLDNIARAMFASGELRRLAWDDGVVGMTSNPTIFEKAMSQGEEYRAPAEALARAGKSTLEIYWTLAIEDIQAAADVMRPIYELSNGLDGYISLECAPGVADDTEGTIAMAADLWQRLDRPNVMIKIPATRSGVAAVEASIASGINVNVTLMFAVELYEQVAEAYLRGLDRFLKGSGPNRLARTDSLVACPVSVASFFVSRVDTLVDKLLDERAGLANTPDERGKIEGLRGKAAVANARLAYASFRRIFNGPRWDSLAAKGASVQRPLWASTSTKNPAYRDVMYIEDLVGPDTVNTVPPATLVAFRDHGRVSRTIDSDGAVEEARRVMDSLATAGIDMQAVTAQLEREGVASFADSFDQLIAALDQRRKALIQA